MSIFSNVQMQNKGLNKFDLSHEKKLSMDMGDLVPFYLEEIVPGDKFKVKSELFQRLAPMTAPVMHRVNTYTHYFFVPNRLVWNEWEDFITGGEDGTAEPVFPNIAVTATPQNDMQKGSLSDYFGIPIPTASTSGLTISSLPFRAYQLIYNEYFRDQNLEEKVNISKASGQETDTTPLMTLRQRAWEKDYFTSALPWSQRGGEAKIPLGTVNPVYKEISQVIDADDPGLGDNVELHKSTNDTLSGPLGTRDFRVENMNPMNVDATTINDLRKANALQRWLERSARGGSRYIEMIKSMFNVTSSDARLQRPEYLGGGKQPIVISEVLASFENETVPQGQMSGHGISTGSKNGFSKSFEEHGFIIGIVSTIPRTTYQQGLEKMWNRFDKYDFYWKDFAHLGEQEIAVSEIFCTFNDATAKDRVFGYQQRYAEYKYKQSTVHGDFRDDLQYWHMGRWFGNDTPGAITQVEPALNSDFVMSNPTNRIWNVITEENQNKLYVQIYNKVDALRPMPYFSIPSL